MPASSEVGWEREGYSASEVKVWPGDLLGRAQSRAVFISIRLKF